MARHLSMIKDITPDTPRGWKVKILVLEKLPLRKATSGSPYDIQRFILADSDGTKVQATIFNKDINLFKDDLVPLTKYYISNARVRIAPKNFQMVTNRYQWTIYHGTLIDQVDDDTDALATNPFNFIPISELVDHRQGINSIDVLLIALEMLPAREQPTRKGPIPIQEIIVIDTSLKPIIFTLWGHFTNREGHQIAGLIADMPIIAAMRVKASSYNGVSISTWGTNSIMIGPEIPDAINLRQWCAANKTLIEELMNSTTYFALAKRLGPDHTTTIIEISELTSFPDNVELPIKCSLEVVDVKNLYFIACSNCNKSTTAEMTDKFRCVSCRVAGVEAIPICRAYVKATDGSGTINATMFGKDAENLLQCNARTIVENMNQVKPPDVQTYIKTCCEEEKIYQIKGYHTEFGGNFTRKFKISQFKEINADQATTQHNLIEAANEELITTQQINVDQATTQHNLIEAANEELITTQQKLPEIIEVGVETTITSSLSTPQSDVELTVVSAKAGDTTKGKSPKTNKKTLMRTRASDDIEKKKNLVQKIMVKEKGVASQCTSAVNEEERSDIDAEGKIDMVSPQGVKRKLF